VRDEEGPGVEQDFKEAPAWIPDSLYVENESYTAVCCIVR